MYGLYYTLTVIILVYVNIPILTMVEYLIYLVPVILSAAYFSLIKRTVLAVIHKRVSPAITRAPISILQPLVNSLKLIFKENCIPTKSGKLYFILTPIYTFALALLLYTTIPVDKYVYFYMETKFSLILIVCLFEISNHSILFRSTFSNNKMAVISVIQSAILSISHRLSLFTVMLETCFLCGTLNLRNILFKQGECISVFLCLAPFVILYSITLLSETKKVPFDTVESEAETASEFIIEYSNIGYAFLALSKYVIMLCAMNVFLSLFTKWTSSFKMFLKFMFILYLFLFIRASLPNFRFDQASYIHWKYIMPLSLLILITLISFMCIILFLSKSYLIEAPFVLEQTVEKVVKPLVEKPSSTLIHVYKLTEWYAHGYDPDDWCKCFKVFECRSYLYSLDKTNFLYFKDNLGFFNSIAELEKLAIYDTRTNSWLHEEMLQVLYTKHNWEVFWLYLVSFVLFCVPLMIW